MLRHEEPSEQSLNTQPPVYASSATPQAADSRVSPDELVAAISAIESRRSEKERWQAGTVALGDAVQQLGLNVTPGELMAEIERVRNQQFTDVRIKAGRANHRRSVAAIIAVALLLFTIPIALLFWTSASTQVTLPPAMAAENAIAGTATAAAPQFETTLSTLPDNKEAFTTLGSIFEFNRGKSSNEITLSSAQQVEDSNSNTHRWQWTVVKHNGEAYLKGWAAKQKGGTFTRIYSTQPEKMDVLSPVSIPVSALQNVRDPSGMIQERRDPGFTLNSIEYLDLTQKQVEATR